MSRDRDTTVPGWENGGHVSIRWDGDDGTLRTSGFRAQHSPTADSVPVGSVSVLPVLSYDGFYFWVCGSHRQGHL